MNAKAIEIPSHMGRTRSVAFKPDSHQLAAAYSSGDLRLWRIDSGQEPIPSAIKATGIGNVCAAVAVSMDGKWIVTGGSRNKVIVWSADIHRIAVEISEHTDYVSAVDVSSDSTRIASGSQDHTVRIFNIISGVRVVLPLQHKGLIVGVKFSPDGSRIATAALSQPIGIYDSCSGDELFDIPIQVNYAPITPLAWSSDGRQLFIGTLGKITSFDTRTSSCSEWPTQIGSNYWNSIVTYGQFIACSAGTSVSFWDYTSHQQIGTIINHATVVDCISISHDGRYLACGHVRGITVHNLGGFLPHEYLRAGRVSWVPLMQVREVVLQSWALGNLVDAASILSEEVSQCSNPSHYSLAARSLIRAQLRELDAANEDAERSLQIKQSPIGQIARSLALVGAGKQDVALEDFDFVFPYCYQSDIILLLVIKAILMFKCGKHKEAISRLRGLIAAVDEKTKGHYVQVLGKMYLKQGDYQNAVQTLEHARITPTPQESDPLITISLIFNWKFDRLEKIAWQRLCMSQYTSGHIQEVGETLLRMVGPLAEDKKESAHGGILGAVIMRSGEVTLLGWTGKPSKCNSCLPSSPAVYCKYPFALSRLEDPELEEHVDELQDIFKRDDALVIYERFTRLQPVRFAHFRLHLPCIVFAVTSLRQEEENVYIPETIGLGDVKFTTADPLPLKKPRRLVFVDTRIHGLQKTRGLATWESGVISESDTESDSERGSEIADTDAGLMRTPIIGGVPSTPSEYTRALQLIAHLKQPFRALLLLRQSGGAYKRVAAEHEFIVRGTGNEFPKDVRVEVLEIL